MKYYKKIVGKEIYLSPLNTEDVSVFCKWLNDKSITDNTGMSEIMTTPITEGVYLEENSKAGKYQFAIVKKENDVLIGSCGFNEVDFIRQTGMIGLFIGEEENRGKGYGREVLNLLLEYGFHTLNLHNIWLRAFSHNERAISLYRRVGFKEIGRRRESYFLNGKRYDDVYMDMLREEFEK